MMVLSIILSRNDSAYHMSVTFFFVFLIACCINLFQAVIIGTKIEYADGFRRKVYLMDAKTNTTEELYDDGSFIIKDDEIVGRMRIVSNLTMAANEFLKSDRNKKIFGTHKAGNWTFGNNNGGNWTKDISDDIMRSIDMATGLKEDHNIRGHVEP